MKKFFCILFAATIAVSALAQEPEQVVFRFGCISYEKVLVSMPEYAQVETDLNALKEQYDAEMKVSEEEFNTKYETFLSEYTNYAPSILRKHQSELEDMMHRNEMFRLETLRLLKQAREDMIKPVREKLDAVIAEVAAEYSLSFVVNTDSDAMPFMNKDMAYNITEAVEEMVTK